MTFGCIGTWKWRHNFYLQMALPFIGSAICLAYIGTSIFVKRCVRGERLGAKGLRTIYHPCISIMWHVFLEELNRGSTRMISNCFL